MDAKGFTNCRECESAIVTSRTVYQESESMSIREPLGSDSSSASLNSNNSQQYNNTLTRYYAVCRAESCLGQKTSCRGRLSLTHREPDSHLVKPQIKRRSRDKGSDTQSDDRKRGYSKNRRVDQQPPYIERSNISVCSYPCCTAEESCPETNRSIRDKNKNSITAAIQEPGQIPTLNPNSTSCNEPNSESDKVLNEQETIDPPMDVSTENSILSDCRMLSQTSEGIDNKYDGITNGRKSIENEPSRLGSGHCRRCESCGQHRSSCSTQCPATSDDSHQSFGFGPMRDLSSKYSTNPGEDNTSDMQSSCLLRKSSFKNRNRKRHWYQPGRRRKQSPRDVLVSNRSFSSQPGGDEQHRPIEEQESNLTASTNQPTEKSTDSVRTDPDVIQDGEKEYPSSQSHFSNNRKFRRQRRDTQPDDKFFVEAAAAFVPLPFIKGRSKPIRNPPPQSKETLLSEPHQAEIPETVETKTAEEIQVDSAITAEFLTAQSMIGLQTESRPSDDGSDVIHVETFDRLGSISWIIKNQPIVPPVQTHIAGGCQERSYPSRLLRKSRRNSEPSAINTTRHGGIRKYEPNNDRELLRIPTNCLFTSCQQRFGATVPLARMTTTDGERVHNRLTLAQMSSSTALPKITKPWQQRRRTVRKSHAQYRRHSWSSRLLGISELLSHEPPKKFNSLIQISPVTERMNSSKMLQYVTQKSGGDRRSSLLQRVQTSRFRLSPEAANSKNRRNSYRIGGGDDRGSKGENIKKCHSGYKSGSSQVSSNGVGQSDSTTSTFSTASSLLTSRSISSLLSKSFESLRHSLSIVADRLKRRQSRVQQPESSSFSSLSLVDPGWSGTGDPLERLQRHRSGRRARKKRRKSKNRKQLLNLISYRRSPPRNGDNFSSLPDVIMADIIEGSPTTKGFDYSQQSSVSTAMSDTASNTRIIAVNLIGEAAAKRFSRGVPVGIFVATDLVSWTTCRSFSVIYPVQGTIIFKRGSQSRPLPLDAIYELNRDPALIQNLVPSPMTSENPSNSSGMLIAASEAKDSPDDPMYKCSHMRRSSLCYKLLGSRSSYNRSQYSQSSTIHPDGVSVSNDEFHQMRERMKHFVVVRTRLQRDPLVIVFDTEDDVEKFIDLALFLQSYSGTAMASLVHPFPPRGEGSITLIRVTALANQNTPLTQSTIIEPPTPKTKPFWRSLLSWTKYKSRHSTTSEHS